MENGASAHEKSALKGKTKGINDHGSSIMERGEEASASKPAALKSKISTEAKDNDGRVPKDADGKTWICICRPADDVAKELDVDEDEEAVKDTCDGGKDCMCTKPAADYPEHKWVVTKHGFELMQEWNVQQAKRNQDCFDMHIFNDFNGYGTCEVIENMFLAFAEEEKKKTQNALAMWSILESVALFFTGGDMMQWHMLNDSEGNAKRIMLIGTMVLTTIDVLIEKGLFKNDSEIRNIGLVLSQLLQFAEDENEMGSFNEDGWKATVVQKWIDYDISIEGVAGVDQLFCDIRAHEDISDSEDEDEDRITGMVNGAVNMVICYKSRELWGVMTVEKLNSGHRRSWKQWNWRMELEAYSSAQAVKVWATGPSYGGKIGGNFYDLTSKRNKGSHTKRYKLGEGMFEDGSD